MLIARLSSFLLFSEEILTFYFLSVVRITPHQKRLMITMTLLVKVNETQMYELVNNILINKKQYTCNI